MSKILTNREILVAIGRTRTSDVIPFLKDKFSSIVRIDFFDTTSSAGDWSGLIVQKIGKNKHVGIIFSMENMWCGDGFRVNTDDVYYDLPKNYTLNDLYDTYNDKIVWY